MTPRQSLVRAHARTIARGSSFIALGVVVGIVLSCSDSVARALACAALVVEIGSAVVVMRRGLRAVARLEQQTDSKVEHRQPLRRVVLLPAPMPLVARADTDCQAACALYSWITNRREGKA